MNKFVFLLLFSIVSCTGYKLTNRSNPFIQYGIRSISVPMFYNHSSYSNVSSIFTQKIHYLLTEFDGLEVVSGQGNTDAVLVGIIGSREKINDASSSDDMRIARSISPDTLEGKRGEFYVPANTTNNLDIRFIVIKNPTQAELELLNSPYGKNIKANSKIIFNESIVVSREFNRELFSGESTQINYTQNRGAEKENLKKMADSAATTFKEMILYAF